MINSFRDVMAQVPTCTAVIFCKADTNDDLIACTISSLISLSVEVGNEKLAFVLKSDSRTGSILIRKKNFTISILSENQSNIAKFYGGQVNDPQIENFVISQIHIADDTRITLQNETLNFYVCVEEIFDIGISKIYVCKVLETTINENSDLKPLIYFNRLFGYFSKSHK